MSTVVAGILGVVAGALTTSGTQIWITSRQRRNDALAAARITCGALTGAIGTIEGSMEAGSWMIGIAHLERDLSQWDDNRIAVARSVDGFGFRILEGAFLRLRETLEQAGLFDDAGLTAVATDPRLKEDLFWFQRARSVALRAGQTRRERALDPRRKRKWAAQMKAAVPPTESQAPINQDDEIHQTGAQRS